MNTNMMKKELKTEFGQEGFYGKFYKAFAGVVSLLRHPLLLIIRLYWGILLVAVGTGKFSALSQVAASFKEINIPFPLFFAGLVAFFEVAGGVSFILGGLTRFFSLIVSVILFFAYYLAHFENLSQALTNPPSFIAASPFLYLYASLILLSFGAGAFSLDYWMEKKMYGHNL